MSNDELPPGFPEGSIAIPAKDLSVLIDLNNLSRFAFAVAMGFCNKKTQEKFKDFSITEIEDSVQKSTDRMVDQIFQGKSPLTVSLVMPVAPGYKMPDELKRPLSVVPPADDPNMN